MVKKITVFMVLILISAVSWSQSSQELVYLFDELDAMRVSQADAYCQGDEAEKLFGPSKSACSKAFTELHQRCTWLDLVEYQQGRRVSLGAEWKKIRVEPAQVHHVARLVESCVVAERQLELRSQP